MREEAGYAETQHAFGYFDRDFALEIRESPLCRIYARNNGGVKIEQARKHLGLLRRDARVVVRRIDAKRTDRDTRREWSCVAI
ncbi:hypothetical protein BURK_008081 [Burkholderia sp. SJ98]|nr:hypothetical protein BURK_008081 [Burkholderia sp. SJ98]